MLLQGGITSTTLSAFSILGQMPDKIKQNKDGDEAKDRDQKTYHGTPLPGPLRIANNFHMHILKRYTALLLLDNG
jgi:hypothetical protein